MSKQLAKQAPAAVAVDTNPLVKALRSDLYRESKKFASLLGVAETDKRFVAWASEVAHVVSLNQKLLQADRASLLEALRTALTLGLSINPALGETYLVPRWSSQARANLVQCQVGYKGQLALVHKTEMIDAVEAQVVYRGEQFVYHGGTNARIEHEPDILGDLRTGNFDDIVCAYAVFYLRGSTRPIFKVVTKRELEHARSMNLDRHGNPSVPWRDHAEAMACKVAISRATKLLPRHNRLADFHRVIEREEAVEISVEQVAQEPSGPAAPEDDPWAVACYHYGTIGIAPERILAFFGVASHADMTPDHFAELSDLYGRADNGDGKARATLETMRSGSAVSAAEGRPTDPGPGTPE